MKTAAQRLVISRMILTAIIIFKQTSAFGSSSRWKSPMMEGIGVTTEEDNEEKVGHNKAENDVIQTRIIGSDLIGENEKVAAHHVQIIEEDIAVETKDEENSFRVGNSWISSPMKIWPNKTVFYSISDFYLPTEYLMIERAFKTLEFLSCLRFVPWDGQAPDYVRVEASKTQSGCWSYIGRRGGLQILSLARPDSKSCNCFCHSGRILHEAMHLVGFYHEHSRIDRDEYIEIVEANVKKGAMKNFKKRGNQRAVSEFEYDYSSIMHYGPLYFSKDKKSPTIKTKKVGQKIGQRVMLSKVDCMKLNFIYDCFGSPWINTKIQILCGLFAFDF